MGETLGPSNLEKAPHHFNGSKVIKQAAACPLRRMIDLQQWEVAYCFLPL